MIEFIGNIKNWADIILLLIPIVVILFLILKFVVPKHPALGIGLAGGVGLLGYFLVRRQMNNAFEMEKKIAEHNQMMADFKTKQKTRYNAVVANKQIISNLEKQRQKLAQDEDKYRDELRLLDAELEDRKKLNDELLQSSSEFLAASASRSQQRQRLLQDYEVQSRSSEQSSDKTTKTSTTAEANKVIEIDGYHLKEV